MTSFNRALLDFDHLNVSGQMYADASSPSAGLCSGECIEIPLPTSSAVSLVLFLCDVEKVRVLSVNVKPDLIRL